MDPSEYEDALRRIHKKAQQTAKLDPDSDEVLVAQLACYAIRELHAKGVPPNTAIRAMTILRYSEKKQRTGNAIKQAKGEIRDNTCLTGMAKKLKATLNTLPEEVRLQILRLVIPEQYDVEMHDFGGTQTSLGETQNPSLPLLLVNRKICQETKTLSSSGVVASDRITTALEAVSAVCEAKKRCIKLIKITLDHPIDVLDRWFKDGMPEGWSDARKRRVEESVQRSAEEMCRRLGCWYEHRSVKEAQILWFDKDVTMPGYWECITINVDGYRRKSFLQ